MTGVAHARGFTSSRELYVPINTSPGISGVCSIQGNVTLINKTNQTINVKNDDGTYLLKLDDNTTYFLDRSHLIETNLVVSIERVNVNDFVEIAHDDCGLPHWVKIKEE